MLAHPDQNRTASLSDIDDHYLIACTGGPSSHRDTFDFKYFWMTGITKHSILTIMCIQYSRRGGGGGGQSFSPPPLNFYNVVPHSPSLPPPPPPGKLSVYSPACND